MAILKIVRDLKQGCKCIPLRLGVVFVSLFVALGVNVGMKWTSNSFLREQPPISLSKLRPSNSSYPFLGHRIIEEISRQLIERIFDVEPCKISKLLGL
jgi:hypothetical protein